MKYKSNTSYGLVYAPKIKCLKCGRFYPSNEPTIHQTYYCRTTKRTSSLSLAKGAPAGAKNNNYRTIKNKKKWIQYDKEKKYSQVSVCPLCGCPIIKKPDYQFSCANEILCNWSTEYIKNEYGIRN